MFLRYIFAVFFCAPAAAVSAADAVDADGYPVMYVRGSATDNWSTVNFTCKKVVISI